VEEKSISASSKTAASALNALLGKRLAPPTTAPESEPAKEKEEVSSALMKMDFQQDARLEEEMNPAKDAGSGSRPAVKDDPKYARYFHMLKVGMPMDAVKHAMTRDDLDPSVMDGDHNKPAGGIPLKEDPKFQRYF
jgi:cyanate lyase